LQLENQAYPIIGVQLDSAYTGQGAKIESLTADSPAATTALKAGDVITQIDGVKITSATELVVRIRSKSPGDLVKITLLDGTVIELTLGSDQS